MPDELWSDEEWRAAMSSADINDLPDSDFAYIEDGGEKDDEGKTVPRSLRHFPVQDADHTRNALARAPQSPFGDKAMPKILAAAKKFGIDVSEKKSATAPLPVRHKKPRHRAGPAPAYEVRHFAAEGLEVRAASDGSDTIEITGFPIVYDTPYAVRDMFGEFQETMKPGVAANVLAAACDTRFLVNHAGLPLARTVSGTMKMKDTPTKLGFTAGLDARQSTANDLAIAIERGDVTQMSCGFIVAPGGDEWASDEERSVWRFSDLLDVSAVTYPASPTTTISVAERMMFEAPVESRARVRRMWAISTDLRAGRQVPREDIDLLTSGLKSLAETEPEDRAAPTAQDGKVMAKIKALHGAVTDALHAQAGDPDNGTDPVDDDVFTHLKNAQAHITKALQAQAVDGAPDDSAAADGDGAIQPEGGPEGTQNAPNPEPSVAADGTGSRSTAALALELEMLHMRPSRRPLVPA